MRYGQLREEVWWCPGRLLWLYAPRTNSII